MSCLSDLTLDLGASDPESTAHLAGCQRCRERLALFDSMRTQAAPDIQRLLARAQPVTPLRRPRPSRWLGWSAATAVAAAAALLIVFNVTRQPRQRPLAPPQSTSPEDDGIRAKGAGVKFFRQRDGVVQRASSGDHFRAGDALQFTVTSSVPGHFLLFGVDHLGQTVTAYHPFGGTSSVFLPPTVDAPLSHSLVLDDAPGPEYIMAVFSPRPLSLDEVRQALARTRQGAPKKSVDDWLYALPLPGTVQRITIGKD